MFVTAHPEARMAMMLATHSPYIVNYANLLLQASRCQENENAPAGNASLCLHEKQLAVYLVSNGTLQSLMGHNGKTETT